MEVDKAIKERHSVRSFKKGIKVDYKKLIEIIDAGRQAPAAGSSPCIRYILVNDKNKIIELANAAQQDFIRQVEAVIVICSDKQFIAKTYQDRTDRYVKQQAGAAIENMLLKTVDLGFSSCWIGAFSDEIVKRVLKIPDNIEVEAFLPIGKEMGKGKSRFKPELDSVLFFNEWRNKNLDGKKSMTASTQT